MTAYNWTIENLEFNVNDGGVIVAHWRCVAKDGDYSASAYGTAGFSPDPNAEGFVPYDQLTESDVLSWVLGSIDKDAIQTALLGKIDDKKHPKFKRGLPWSLDDSIEQEAS